ncbi:MAG: hypothetical protein R3C28_18880 [Pirellulaceae bacterium]
MAFGSPFPWASVEILVSQVQICAENGIKAVASWAYTGPNSHAGILNITGQFFDYDFGNSDALDVDGSDWEKVNLAPSR